MLLGDRVRVQIVGSRTSKAVPSPTASYSAAVLIFDRLIKHRWFHTRTHRAIYGLATRDRSPVELYLVLVDGIDLPAGVPFVFRSFSLYSYVLERGPAQLAESLRGKDASSDLVIPNSRSTNYPALPSETRRRIVDWALRAEMASPERRPLLLSGSLRHMRSQLPTFRVPSDQLTSDLLTLSFADPIDGHPPVLVWLKACERIVVAEHFSLELDGLIDEVEAWWLHVSAYNC